MQTLKATGPKSSVLLGPAMDVVERPGIQAVNALKTAGPALHQAGPMQDLEMLRHRGVREANFVHQIAHRPFASPQRVDESSPVHVGHRMKYVDFGSSGCGHAWTISEDA
jgi:hypothetical protein